MWEIIRANKKKSAILVILMAFLLFAVGYTAGILLYGPDGGSLGLFGAFIIWIILCLSAYFQGKKIFLAFARARKINKEDHPRLFNVVEEMKIASQLPAMPDIYIIDDPAPNAFATGRNPQNAAVAVTTGLLNMLNRDELQGVIAHEIGHIKNRDILFMTMLGVMMGTVVMLADLTLRTLFWSGGRRRTRTSSGGGNQAQAALLIVGLILMILSPIIAQMIYLAVSRKREYLADASSAQFTRYPEGLAGALEKISGTPVKTRKINKVMAPMYIVNPLQSKSVKAFSLFSTHPSTLERIKILRSMAGGAGYLAYNQAFQKVTGARQPVLPKSALSGTADVPLKGKDKVDKASPKPPLSPEKTVLGVAIAGGAIAEDTYSARVRETTNALWRIQKYRFISCPCGAVLKIPPTFHRPQVICLRCHRKHDVPQNKPVHSAHK